MKLAFSVYFFCSPICPLYCLAYRQLLVCRSSTALCSIPSDLTETPGNTRGLWRQIYPLAIPRQLMLTGIIRSMCLNIFSLFSHFHTVFKPSQPIFLSSYKTFTVSLRLIASDCLYDSQIKFIFHPFFNFLNTLTLVSAVAHMLGTKHTPSVQVALTGQFALTIKALRK